PLRRLPPRRAAAPGPVARDAEAQPPARDHGRAGAPLLQLPARHPLAPGDPPGVTPSVVPTEAKRSGETSFRQSAVNRRKQVPPLRLASLGSSWDDGRGSSSLPS